MKLNKKMMYNAIARTCLALCDMTDFSKTVVEVINDNKPNSVELNSCKNNGFVLRCRKDVALSDTQIFRALSNATNRVLTKLHDDVSDYMSETFDLEFDSGYITPDYAQEIYDVSHSGRLIYIEADM